MVIVLVLIVALPLHADLSAQQRGIHILAKSKESFYLYEDYHALVVGVSDYDTWPDLPNAVKDAEEVAAVLEGSGFKVKLLLNPTSKQLNTALNDIAFLLGSEKNRALLFYFAGHGETLELADETELGYIIPSDCPLKSRDPRGFDDKAVSMKEIESLALKVKSKHFLIMFDSCFSGSLFNLVRAAPVDITEKSIRPVRQFITAGEAGEQVPDKSIFKLVFLDGIRGEADLNDDGYVTGSELGMHLQDKVVNYTRGGQHPQYGKINNPKLDKGDFIFALKRPSEPLRSGAVTSPPPSEPGIREREADERRWVEFQNQMDGDFARAVKFDQSERLEPDEKIKIWSEFLSSYVKNNPYSGKDDELRQEAEKRRRYWKEFKVATVEKPPVSPDKNAFTNSIGMKFVYIPPGTFMMGSPSDELGRSGDETLHQVTLTKGFYIGTTEVTQGQWRSIMGNNPSRFKNCGYNCPVERVSWIDIQEFIRRLNQQEGTDKYRLPTEAEWEYACRAGATTPFYTGNCISTDRANYNGNQWLSGCPKGKYRRRTVSVGSFPPNPSGLYVMHGNVWEWCQDRYGDYPSGHVSDPEGPSSGKSRVVRGGSWYNSAKDLRSASRGRYDPGKGDDDLGFRVARTY